MPVLTDGVVVLRELTPDDVDTWHAGEDDEQIRWFEQPGPAPRENVVRAVDEWVEQWAIGGGIRMLGITDADADTGELAGGVELRLLADEPGVADLSYVVFPPFRRRGFAVRASRLLVAWASEHLGVDEVEIEVVEGNEASLAVASRLGAVPVGARPSDGGATFVVHRLTAPGTAARPRPG